MLCHPADIWTEPTMSSRTDDPSKTLDRVTSRSICDAVGERLRRDLQPEPLQRSSRLEDLIDQLRQRDHESQARN
jgi:hypothetical protein